MLLDERDHHILRLLRQDCRLSNADLAGKVGMSPSACWRRVKAFEDAGIIERYGAILRPGPLGLNFQAIVHVQMVRHDPAAMEAFLRGVDGREEISACYATTGQADYHLLVQCADIDAYNRFLEDFLFRLPAVRGAQTNVILKDLKAG